MLRKLIFYMLLLASYSGFAQDLPDIRLNIFVSTNLDKALQRISDKYNLSIYYDTARFKHETILAETVRDPLDKYLKKVCHATKQKYFVDESGNIRIVERWYTPDKAEIAKEEKYSGTATRHNFTLSGKIIDRETQEALPFVTVRALGSTGGAQTNVDGNFTLIKVPSDTSTLILSYIGYQTRNIQLTPQLLSQKLVIDMNPDIIGLEEVVVSAEKQDILQVSAFQTSMIKMSPKKLNTLPNLGEKDILRSFQLMPGISAANENSSGLYVRGGTPDQVLVRYDGFTVYNVEHMFGFFSAFNSNAIKDVQLYKGGFSAKFGGRLSSVVEITGKEGDKNGFNAAVDMSMMSLNGFVEFPMGDKATAIFSGRRSWKSPLYNKIFDQFSTDTEAPVQMGGPGGRGGMEQNQETVSYFYDLNGKITYKPSDKDVLTFSIYNGMDDLDNSILPQSRTMPSGETFTLDIETVDLTQWGNTGASVKWSRQFSDRLYMNALASYSNYFSLRERSTSGSFMHGSDDSQSLSRGVNEDNNLVDYSGNFEFEYKLTNNNRIDFGLQNSYINIDYTYKQNDTITVIDRGTEGQVYTAYVQDNITLFDSKLKIIPGLRSDYFTGTNKFYYEPRLNIMYQLTDQLKLKGAAGTYYQFAKRVIREDITEGSRDFWALSDNDQLPVSSSDQYIAGASYETNAYIFDVEAFYKNLHNVTEYSLRIEPDPRNVNYSENFYTGNGVAKGVEWLAQKKSGKFTGWLGYTWSQVTNNISEFGDYDYFASHDVTHEFKIVATYQWRQWDFGFNWIYATGKPYTAPEGGYQLTLLDGSSADYINVSVKNGNRLPAYHRLDLSATYNFTFGAKAPASLSFSLFNAYNRANVWYNEYEIIDNEIIETPVYYLGITPNVSLSFKLK